MKKLIFASLATAALCSFAAFADEMTGYISDAHCGAAHSSVSAANTKCIEGCLKKGTDPVLVNDGKVMKFTADSAKKVGKLCRPEREDRRQHGRRSGENQLD